MKIDTSNLKREMNMKLIDQMELGEGLSETQATNMIKKMIENNLKEYTLSKLLSFGLGDKTIIKMSKSSLEEILLFADKQIEDKQDKIVFFDNYIYYLADKIGLHLYDVDVLTEADNKNEFQPVFVLWNGEKWDKLLNRANISPVELTLEVLNIFKTGEILKNDELNKEASVNVDIDASDLSDYLAQNMKQQVIDGVEPRHQKQAIFQMEKITSDYTLRKLLEIGANNQEIIKAFDKGLEALLILLDKQITNPIKNKAVFASYIYCFDIQVQGVHGKDMSLRKKEQAPVEDALDLLAMFKTGKCLEEDKGKVLKRGFNKYEN